MCADGVSVPFSIRILGDGTLLSIGGYNASNLIRYEDERVYITRKKTAHVRLLVSGTLFNRDVSQIEWAARDIKTVAFPNTIREVQGYLF